MSKVFLAMFGGTPARGELCLYLNAMAGLYRNCSGIQCYPIDKDTESPNYVNTRNLYNQYTALHEVVKGQEMEMASVDIVRTEDMFENMLREAVQGDENIAEEENIRYLMSDEKDGISGEDQRVLNICFTQEEQKEKMKGGYYGKANIGSVTGDILINQGVYQKFNLCRDIKNDLKAGYELDVVIVCSSFGGTGASLGINYGEYLRNEFAEEEKLHIHCIYIQPYFSFPDPEEESEWKIDCKKFYAKSATAAAILGRKEKFIKKDDEQAVFDRFYYIGQDVLDKISDKNSAMSNQDNRVHMVDMLTSLAIEDILTRGSGTGLQLYGYQYSNEGAEYLSWANMPLGIGFKKRHVSMMRFCEFMIDCMEPLFSDNYHNYDQEALVIHIYGHRGNVFSKKKAEISESIKVQLQNDMRKCFEACRSYIKYWIELEESSKFGNEQTSATCFFNLDELKRILQSHLENYDNVRFSANSLDLTKTKGYNNYENGKRCIEIYDSLCHNKFLKGIAKPGSDKAKVVKILLAAIYEECKVENYDSLQD